MKQQKSSQNPTDQSYEPSNNISSQIYSLPLNLNYNHSFANSMYKGKNLTKVHEQIFKKNQQFLISAGINITNPPNPYDIIKEEQAKARLQKQNGHLPYRWARQQIINPHLNYPQQDPNASITISRAEMTRQGFQRQMNQAFSSQNQNYRPNTNTQNNSRFPSSNDNNNQRSIVPAVSNSNNINWFDQLFQDSNSAQHQPPIQSNNNYRPNNSYKPNTNTYQSSNLNQFNFQPRQNDYPQLNNYNDQKESNYNNLQQRTINRNVQQQHNKSYYNHQQQNTCNDFDENQPIEQKPTTLKPLKARDLFKKQQPSKNETQQRQRPSQRIYKDYQKLQGIVECDKTKNLTTTKILASIETFSQINYIIGDVKMWQIHNQYPDHVLKEALRNFPHVKEFKNNQKAIIKCALNGNDVFICIPTGGGKSLIFQLMTFIKKGIYLCVLPLVSLIYDQELQAQKYQIEAYSLTGATQANKSRFIISQIQNYKPGQKSILIFCTPEKIASSQNFIELLTSIYHKGYLQHVIIDEVHCVSTWGKEFRKEYENLSALKEYFPKIPILGLTATVTQKVKQEIINKLRLKNCYFFQSSFNRPNLLYEVKQKSKRSAVEEICKILQDEKQNSGIIYCLSKKECEQMCKSLNNRGFKTAYYHADLHDKQKRQVQLMWMQDKIKIIVATIAFGMGINKADVRFVIHNSLSKSLEGYYQESGRAGRDGLPARCILFYNRSDRTALQSMILKNDYSSAAQKLFGNQQLAQMVKYCEEKYICRRQFQLNYLGEKDFNPANCNKTCDNCRKGLVSKEFQCIHHAKQIVKVIQFVVQSKDKITKSQLINTLKGKDPNNYHKVLRYSKLSELRTMFKFWTNDHLEELLLELLNHEIIKEHAVTAKVKFGNATNIYVEYNSLKSKKFLEQVQTFPMRRVVRPQIPQRYPAVILQKPQFNIQDLFSDSDDQKNAFEQKQTKSDYGEMNISHEPYDQVDFSSADEIGIDLGQYQYEDGLSDGFFGSQNDKKPENNERRDEKIRLGLKDQQKKEPNLQKEKKSKQDQEKQQRIKSSIDYIMKLFDNDDDDVLI